MLKLFLAFIYVQFNRQRLYRMDIWLVQEKHTEARDNGYHLFKYLRTVHPEIKAFYSITRNSADRRKVEPYGNIIDADTIKHYVYYLSAKYSIGSQKWGACPYPTDWVNRFHFLCRKDQKIIFLQHGITKDAVPGLDFYRTNFDLFICAGKPEYQHILQNLHYPESNAKLVGFCRFDNLNIDKKGKQILIMPTFRQWLAAEDREKDATAEECTKFMQSDFYANYAGLLLDLALLETARKNHYWIVFYLHYSLQSFTKTFAKYGNDVVTIADRQHYDVQQLMLESAVMVTDFSSVFFDFAYMKKPEIFFQFDEDAYRAKHYSEGYFDYRRDGFGPVYTDCEDVVRYLTELMENGCEMEQTYQDKVDAFFAFRDHSNCERNYEAIKALGERV